MNDKEPPEYGDIVNFPDGPKDGAEGKNRRWIVLYPDDYHKHANDMEDNVGVLVDAKQASELYRLCVETMLALEHPDGGEKVLDKMIDTLEAAKDE